MRLVCPRFWWVLPLRWRQVLPGRCRQPPPGAVSTEARLRLLSPCPFLPPQEKLHSPDPPPRELCVQTPFYIKERQLIGRFRDTKPHPVTQDPSFIGVTSCHPAFLPVNWSYSSPAPFVISNPIRCLSESRLCLLSVGQPHGHYHNKQRMGGGFAVRGWVFGALVSMPLRART